LQPPGRAAVEIIDTGVKAVFEAGALRVQKKAPARDEIGG
jgi:hypothetical protein